MISFFYLLILVVSITLGCLFCLGLIIIACGKYQKFSNPDSRLILNTKVGQNAVNALVNPRMLTRAQAEDFVVALSETDQEIDIQSLSELAQNPDAIDISSGDE